MLAICERISRKLRSQFFFFFTIVIWQMIVYKFFNGKQMISGSDRQQLAFCYAKSKPWAHDQKKVTPF